MVETNKVNYKKEIIKLVERNINKQIAKGMRKYGHTLEDCPVDRYDWQAMLIEELIDALQYQQKELQRLKMLSRDAQIIQLKEKGSCS